jgi:hypothetical protein
MATVFEFTIASEGTFPNQVVDVPSFTEEIQASAITAALVSIAIVDGNCVVTFATDLTDAEVTLLSQLVQAHSATKNGEPHMLPYIWQVKNPPASLAASAMKVVGLANIIDEYNLMRPATPAGVNIRLKNALTQGSLTLTLTKNGAATSKSKTVVPGTGRMKLWLLPPGNLAFEKGDTIGLQITTSADMLPASDNEVSVNLEVAWKL